MNIEVIHTAEPVINFVCLQYQSDRVIILNIDSNLRWQELLYCTTNSQLELMIGTDIVKIDLPEQFRNQSLTIEQSGKYSHDIVIYIPHTNIDNNLIWYK